MYKIRSVRKMLQEDPTVLLHEANLQIDLIEINLFETSNDGHLYTSMSDTIAMNEPRVRGCG